LALDSRFRGNERILLRGRRISPWARPCAGMSAMITFGEERQP
jgi:hypothetical protein